MHASQECTHWCPALTHTHLQVVIYSHIHNISYYIGLLNRYHRIIFPKQSVQVESQPSDRIPTGIIPLRRPLYLIELRENICFFLLFYKMISTARWVHSQLGCPIYVLYDLLEEAAKSTHTHTHTYSVRNNEHISSFWIFSILYIFIKSWPQFSGINQFLLHIAHTYTQSLL